MKTLFFLVAVLTAQLASADEYRFRVLLDDREIGEHSFSFIPLEGDDVYRVVSTARYDVAFLFVNVYQYRHQSREVWAAGCLQDIASATDDNGEEFQVAGVRQPGGLKLTVNGKGEMVAERCVRTFAYWDPRLLAAGQLLNSQTGELQPVEFAELGETPLPWSPATRVRSVALALADGRIELWYDSGRWLGLRSTLENGRVLQYWPADETGQDSARQQEERS